MKSEEDIKKIMELIKTSLTKADGETAASLRGQFAFAEWVLEEVPEKKDGFES